MENEHRLIDLPMPIITPRLTIRPAMPGDGAAMLEAKTETWDQLSEYMPWAKDPVGTVESNEIVCLNAHAKTILREEFMMLAFRRDTMTPIIFTGIHCIDWDVRRAEIGYWCRKSAQGHGFVTESTIALVRYAFNALGMRTVAICHADTNNASRAVIERSGFTHDGIMRGDSRLPTGRIYDTYWYSHTDINAVPALDVRW